MDKRLLRVKRILAVLLSISMIMGNGVYTDAACVTDNGQQAAEAVTEAASDNVTESASEAVSENMQEEVSEDADDQEADSDIEAAGVTEGTWNDFTVYWNDDTATPYRSSSDPVPGTFSQDYYAVLIRYNGSAASVEVPAAIDHNSHSYKVVLACKDTWISGDNDLGVFCNRLFIVK